CSVEHDTYRSGGRSRAAGRRARGTSPALRSESHIPRRSLRPCAAGVSLCRERYRVAVGLCYSSQAPATASLALIGAVAHTAIARGAAADPCAIRTIVGLGTAISGPAGTWAAKLPEGIPRLEERLSFMRAPIDTLQRFLQQVKD